MIKLSKRLPDDNVKLAQLVREFVQGLLARITWYHNIMAGSKDNPEREFYRSYRKPLKVQRLVAQIGWTHKPIILQCCHVLQEGGLEYVSAEAVTLEWTIKKNFEEMMA